MAVGIGDILRNSVKEKLARDEVVASMTVRLVRQIEIAQIAATAGFDTLYIDVEHASVSLETTSQICIAALAAGIAPFVRVPANTPEYISRVLDGGALGIIAPHVGSAEEARAVVDAAKFPPLGSRSAAGAGPHLQYRSFPVAEANAALNDATTVMVQFENAAAIARAEEIVAVPGVDMVMIGSNDLLADWGIPEQYESFRACARPMPRRSQPAASTASTSASAASPAGRRLSPSSSRWGALRLHRHRPRVPPRRLHRAGKAGPRHRGVRQFPPARSCSPSPGCGGGQGGGTGGLATNSPCLIAPQRPLPDSSPASGRGSGPRTRESLQRQN